MPGFSHPHGPVCSVRQEKGACPKGLDGSGLGNPSSRTGQFGCRSWGVHWLWEGRGDHKPSCFPQVAQEKGLQEKQSTKIRVVLAAWYI